MSVPIFIASYNRERPLRALVRWCRGLEGRGTIWVLDNASTWPGTKALLDELRALPPAEDVRVVDMGGNFTYEAPKELWRRYLTARPVGRFVVTDPDLEPSPEPPGDVLAQLSGLLDRCPEISKAGMSLEIRDIPDAYFNAAWVRFWEGGFWENRTPCGKAFFADCDTTFAMYRKADDFLATTRGAARLDRPYTLRHVDWYEDAVHPSAEYAHYLAVAGGTASTARMARAWMKDPRLYAERMKEVIAAKPEDRNGHVQLLWHKILFPFA